MSEGKPREICLSHSGELSYGGQITCDIYRTRIEASRLKQAFISRQPDIICVEKSAYDKAISAMRDLRGMIYKVYGDEELIRKSTTGIDSAIVQCLDVLKELGEV